MDERRSVRKKGVETAAFGGEEFESLPVDLSIFPVRGSRIAYI
jgi:hypothetical protein